MGEPRLQTREVAQSSEHQLLGERPLARVEPRIEPLARVRTERAAVAEHAREQSMSDVPG